MNPKDSDPDGIREASRMYAAGFTLFGAVAVCLGVGWLLDYWLGTSPWLMVAGIVLGSIVGLYEFVRLSTPKDKTGD